MTVLTTQQRLQVRARLGQELSDLRSTWPLNKPDTDAFLAACDDWIEANAASFNNALPAAAKNGLTAAQKAYGFSLVAQKRYGG